MVTPIGIRREDKSRWERRAPLTPGHVAALRERHGLSVVVQSAPHRVFSDEEFVAAGATVASDLSTARLIVGIKEVPPHLVEADKTYMMFAHVIKGQPQNMPMLKRLIEQRCTLVDYEKVTDEHGKRLIFFGWHAGVVAMIESLWALGQRLDWEAIENPFRRLGNTYTYPDLAAVRSEVKSIGASIASEGLPAAIAPMIVGVVGYGNVGRGALEVLSDLPAISIRPTDVPRVAADSGSTAHAIYVATFKEEDIVVPAAPGTAFDLAHYYRHPEDYRPCFATYLPHLTVILHANYWDSRYPRLVTKAHLAELFATDEQPRLRVIGDASCDVEGGIECTILTTEPDEPVYVYSPRTDSADLGVAGCGPVVLAVDILPSELPREASQYFGDILTPHLGAVAGADLSRPLAELDVAAEIQRAVIVHRGELTPPYRYLEQYLGR